MWVCRTFTAFCVYLSETAGDSPTRVGMALLRHKSRHKAAHVYSESELVVFWRPRPEASATFFEFYEKKMAEIWPNSPFGYRTGCGPSPRAHRALMRPGATYSNVISMMPSPAIIVSPPLRL